VRLKLLPSTNISVVQVKFTFLWVVIGLLQIQWYWNDGWNYIFMPFRNIISAFTVVTYSVVHFMNISCTFLAHKGKRGDDRSSWNKTVFYLDYKWYKLISRCEDIHSWCEISWHEMLSKALLKYELAET